MKTEKLAVRNDIVVMRVTLVVMIVVYHAFCPFTGNWPAFPDAEPNTTYFWIGKTMISFALQAFVFISGMLAGYQSLRRREQPYNLRFIAKKARRLLLPSVVFSVIYFAMFYQWEGLPSFAISVTQGCGHLWFLPMLFWCFVALYFFSKVNIHPYWLLAIAAVGTLLTNSRLPLRIGVAMGYFLFFYIGYLTPRGLLGRLSRNYTLSLTTCLVVFIATFAYRTVYQYNSTLGGGICNNIVSSITALSGLLSFYLFVNRNISPARPLPQLLIRLSQYSFGIYILQQFILKALYYNTSLPATVGYTLLPWIAILLTLVLSTAITHLSHKSRLGRFL
ncbi:MAG: acyltransferase, partial [Muribaculum sp.]|nr:acyltransferase [Muribaculaceae bacterium]MCM1081172.1 acyltransferase [Muribaculum sp.]